MQETQNYFVFALLKTVQKQAEEIGLAFRLGWVSGLIIKISCLRSWKLSKNKLSGILDVFCDYLTAMKGVFCYCGRRKNIIST